MDYISQIDRVADLDFQEMATRMKIDQPALFLVDFCSLLYDKAIGYYETVKNSTQSAAQTRAFKIGHVLVNSNQVRFGTWYLVTFAG